MVSQKSIPANKSTRTGRKTRSAIAAGTTKNTKGDPKNLAPGRDFPIVGIGASAGGLETFEQFFTHVPPDIGMAFVLVQHLDPTRKSLLRDLVCRYTRMKVFEVEDGMRVQTNCVYVIPPNRDMAILKGVLHLIEPVAPRGQRLPIDYFFRSLAQDQQELAVAIVLSGTGTDGTLGVKAVKEEGGMIMVQAPDSARYDGMPRSALSTGVADYVLSAEAMANQLVAYMELGTGNKARQEAPPLPVTEDDLKKIFILVRRHTGHDFSLYKESPILRRIKRRMTANQIGELRFYARYLQQDPMEVETLFKEMVIGVTSFFRDPEAFEVLKAKVIPTLFHNRPSDQALRLWVPGCATGEETYSIAMLIRDHMHENGLDREVQIFATDIDAAAIRSARQGIYSESIAADVPPAYLKRYFVRMNNRLQVKRSLREMVVFATHSITKDPPLSKLDLISCRNVLIYMSSDLQKQVLPLFHYALNRGGYLFLGHSESVGKSAELFDPIDRQWKLFQSKGGVSSDIPRTRLQPQRTEPEPDRVRDMGSAASGRRLHYRDLTEKLLLRDHTPTAVLVDVDNNVLFVHGSTHDYFESARSEASPNLLSMTSPELKPELTAALRKARNQRKDVRMEGIHIGSELDPRLLDISVYAVTDPRAPRGLSLVLFEQRVVPQPTDGGDRDSLIVGGVGDERVRKLKHELVATEEHLHTTIEELESSNEELQSTNEELETSRVELHSINEELMTVNSELQAKVQELSQANNDMNNLLAATEIGTLFLDMDLKIMRFTPSVTSLINLIEGDEGRPLRDIAYDLGGVDLVRRSQQVLDQLTGYEHEVQTVDGRYYLLRILPYRTKRNVIDGVVVTLVDVSGQRQAESLFRQSLNNSFVPTIISDGKGLIRVVNPQAERLLGWTEAELKGQALEVLLPQSRREAHRRERERYMHEPHAITPGERTSLVCLRKDGSELKARMGLAPLHSQDETLVMVSILKI